MIALALTAANTLKPYDQTLKQPTLRIAGPVHLYLDN